MRDDGLSQRVHDKRVVLYVEAI